MSPLGIVVTQGNQKITMMTGEIPLGITTEGLALLVMKRETTGDMTGMRELETVTTRKV
jgi:hypothetical protein